MPRSTSQLRQHSDANGDDFGAIPPTAGPPCLNSVLKPPMRHWLEYAAGLAVAMVERPEVVESFIAYAEVA